MVVVVVESTTGKGNQGVENWRQQNSFATVAKVQLWTQAGKPREEAGFETTSLICCPDTSFLVRQLSLLLFHLSVFRCFAIVNCTRKHEAQVWERIILYETNKTSPEVEKKSSAIVSEQLHGAKWSCGGDAGDMINEDSVSRQPYLCSIFPNHAILEEEANSTVRNCFWCILWE